MAEENGPDRVDVLIVDDSATARLVLRKALTSDPRIRVVGEAATGVEALARVVALKPDVVTMDIVMPGGDGYETTQRIMETAPVPIVIISGGGPADADAIRALGVGALGVLAKPAVADDGAARALVAMVRRLAGVRLSMRAPRLAGGARPPVKGDGSRRPRGRAVVAIGASTGGPAALAAILRRLPATLSAPLLIVQHITAGFERELVRWLDSITPLDVVVARHGTTAVGGAVYMAPAGLHLGIDRKCVIELSSSPPIGEHRPSVSHLFSSVAAAVGPAGAGVVLTGMGRDGADGASRLRSAGGWLIAQDEATSAVWGMPREIADRGLASEVLPIDRMAAAITELATPAGAARR